MNDKELQEFTRRNWYTLPEDFRKKVVEYLQTELDVKSYREAIDNDPDSWCLKDGWHMFGGMGIRNLLRENGFTDDKLTDVEYEGGNKYKNWDDFYTAAIEAACGVIEV